MALLPKTGLRPLPFELPQFTEAALAAQARRAAGDFLRVPTLLPRYASAVDDPVSELPEAPLKGPVPIASENVAGALAALVFLQGRARALEVLGVIRKTTVYSGHPGLDAGFWAAYSKFEGLEGAVKKATASVMTVKVPIESPIRERDLLNRVARGFPNQEELDRLFLFGKFEEEAKIRAKIAELNRRIARVTPGGEPVVEDQPALDRLRALEAGFALQPLIAAQREIQLERIRHLRELAGLVLLPNDDPQLPAMPAGSADP